MAVIEERKKKGIDDEIGPDASPIKEDGNKYERGKRNLETLTGRKEIGPKTGFAAFSPEMEGVPGSHLFSHVSRDDLLRNHHVVNVIVIGVSTHPARPLFMSDLRRIYPNVPVLLLRLEAPQAIEHRTVHACRTGQRIRGEFLLSDEASKDEYEIVRALRKILPIRPCSHVGKGTDYETVGKVMRVIGKKYKDPRLNLDNVARELPISRVKLSRILNQQVGLSFRQLLRRARIEEAKSMLVSRRYSVKEVASQVGFSDSHYFSRSFKELTGLSASQYRSKDPLLG